jgi:hypothetical protein
MKKFIKIKRSEWLGGSNTEMIHTDENGERYLGPPIQWVEGSMIAVEISEERMRDGLFHIIKVVGVTRAQRRDR